MAEATKIEWADATFNPLIGCQHATYTDADGKQHAHQGCLHNGY
jgi:protein gp37